MIGAIVINFGNRVSRQEPDAGIRKSACFPNRLEHGCDVIAETESIAIEQLQRIEHLAHRLFISPSGDVIPESRLHEPPIRQEEPPNGFGALSRRPRAGAGVNALSEGVQNREM